MITVESLTFNPYQENTYILHDETNECLIIDPGCYNASEQNELVNLIKSKNLKPVLLINTHCHIDHVLGNKFVFDNWGLKPHFHEQEQWILDAIPGYAPSMGMHYELSPKAEYYLKDGDIIKFGNAKLESIFTPGHSPASLSFYSKADKFVIAGDVLFHQSVGRTDLPGGSFPVLKQSIETRLFPLGDEVKVYPGHGQPTTIGFERLHNPFL
ncbi:MBL fold metallo-hydrolase [Solitalea koreensis]|uniref:Glyoxylase, beta-lactamase superfamily II n=1 Tax=Solitalea koreensis TaxID=543615 RepID=A0A521EFB0_9SPHI|nr:MBL fold metallo-hydrolase [Solitalea koreensis]SMO82542.1 Glyoxylase, beta-lactamase superfamily II [Solitalea koreensis]